MVGRRLTVLVGVTGGIAAYRACELVRLLVRDGVDVRVAMTPQALRFVGETTMAGLSRWPVLTDRPSRDEIYPHLEAARAAAVMVIAPCSANTLAKLAAGIADNVVTESALALAGRLVVCPAMNQRMWRHPATQRNVATLVERGAIVVGPDDGDLAEGETGPGRLAQPEAIHLAVRELLVPSGPLAGRRVLVTAGGTREPLDPVRFIGNRSSGRMGVALADEALARGAEVTTLLCNAAVRPAGGTVIETPTVAALAAVLDEQVRTAEVVIMAAAVSDYTPSAVSSTKRGREGVWELRLEPTPDLLAGIGQRRRPGQVLIGFAAETGDGVARARGKLERKGVDLIVLNDVSRADIGFEVDENEVTLVAPADEVRVAKASKREVAAAILDRVEDLLGGT